MFKDVHIYIYIYKCMSSLVWGPPLFQTSSYYVKGYGFLIQYCGVSPACGAGYLKRITQRVTPNTVGERQKRETTGDHERRNRRPRETTKAAGGPLETTGDPSRPREDP